jgi:hypothetical protein
MIPTGTTWAALGCEPRARRAKGLDAPHLGAGATCAAAFGSQLI